MAERYDYCRRTQAVPGCGAKSPRKLVPVKLGASVRAWLCQRCADSLAAATQQERRRPWPPPLETKEQK
jgi:hypothetical protein